MKTYYHIDNDNQFEVLATWHPDRKILRIESGPAEDPTEMIVEYQGLSKHGARHAVKQHLKDWIGYPTLIEPCLEVLTLTL